jgi:hypothetical protein
MRPNLAVALGLTGVYMLPRPKGKSCGTDARRDLNYEVPGINRQLPLLFDFKCSFADPDDRFNQECLVFDFCPIGAGRATARHVL